MADFVARMHDQEVAGHFQHALLCELDCALSAENMKDTYRVWAALNHLHERIHDTYEESNQNGSCIEPMRDAEWACKNYLEVVHNTFGLEEKNSGTEENER